MARNIRSAQLETRTARLKLAIRKKPPAVRVAPGVRLGYRRNAAAGTWSVIAADGKGGNCVKKFGLADDHEEANGQQVLTLAAQRQGALARGGGVPDKTTIRPTDHRRRIGVHLMPQIRSDCARQ
jgi:hypothetical protein